MAITYLLENKSVDTEGAGVQISTAGYYTVFVKGVLGNANVKLKVSPQSAGAKAEGTIVFDGNVAADDTLTINGTEFTIVASGATGNEINVNTTLSTSLDNIVTALNASAVVGVAKATYSKVSTTTLKVVYDTFALEGNDFTLDAEVLAGATVTNMAGGHNPDTEYYDILSDKAAPSAIVYSVGCFTTPYIVAGSYIKAVLFGASATTSNVFVELL